MTLIYTLYIISCGILGWSLGDMKIPLSLKVFLCIAYPLLIGTLLIIVNK